MDFWLPHLFMANKDKVIVKSKSCPVKDIAGLSQVHKVE